MPTIAEHIAFLRSNPYQAWYIIEQDHKPIGSCYLSKADEIGIAIARDQQGKGYARQAIEELMRIHPKPRYLANIAPHNMPSHKMFMELGFNLIQLTYEHAQARQA